MVRQREVFEPEGNTKRSRKTNRNVNNRNNRNNKDIVIIVIMIIILPIRPFLPARGGGRLPKQHEALKWLRQAKVPKLGPGCSHMSYTLNSLKGGYTGDYIGESYTSYYGGC